MEAILGTLAFFVVLVWGFRLEINSAKTVESLQRIEKLLEEQRKKEK